VTISEVGVSTATGKIETPVRNAPANDKGIPLPPTDEVSDNNL
jgi:hypothetical protein